MKKKFFTAALAGILALSPLLTKAQVIDAEKTYEITRKSKRGTLANVEFDNATGNYTLFYVTKSTDRKAKFEIYVFDKDFNFVSFNEDEIEFEKVKSKYKWFNYSVESYTVEGLFVEPNLMGTLVLKRKEITYSYDWLFLGYRKKTTVKEKLKPKSEDGLKYFYHKHFEDDINGVVYVLAGEKDKMNKDADPNKPFRNLHLLKFNKDLDLLGDVELKFDFPQSVPIHSAVPVITDDPDNPGMGDMVMVFAPYKIPGKGMEEDPNKSNFTYVRVSPDMKLVDRISFNSPAPGWKIDEMIYDNDNDAVYLYGPSAEGKDQYWSSAVMAKKFKAVQLMKVKSHQVEYLTSTNLEEFESKLKTPPSQKKSPAYAGKKFKIASYYKTSNGDFIVLGQNFTPNDKTGPQMKDVLGFHFNDKGVLKAQYGIDTYETNAIAQAVGAPQSLIEGASGKNLYWILNEVDGYAMSGRALTYARIGAIDLSSPDGGINNFITLGGADKKVEFYLDQKFPYLETTKGSTVTFFGSDKKGKNIWFCRVKLD